VPSGQGHNRRLQSRPERARADVLRHARAGRCAAMPAAQLVRAMLGPDHADRRQLGNLVATEPPARTALLSYELAAAPAARIRVVIDDLINPMLTDTVVGDDGDAVGDDRG
jgi:hypothetical protein